LAGADKSVDFRKRVLEGNKGKIGKPGDNRGYPELSLYKRFRLLLMPLRMCPEFIEG
jgi:hypothetical protein